MHSETPHAFEAAQSEADLPATIGRYAIIRRLGRGGFADVYLARDSEGGGLFALKVLRESIDPHLREQVRTRFMAEGAIARAIAHPAIVRIHETSPRGETPCFIAMDFVDGVPFTEYCERLRRPSEPGGRGLGRLAYFAEVARLGHQVARAIAAAHRRGIVHRDLKPDNVLVCLEAGAPRVKILDFGIAKAPIDLFSLDRAAAVTRYYTELGTVMGSPPYMAPEQNGGAHAVTGKADVFALGVMLLVALLGLDTDALEQGEAQLVLPAEFDALVLGSALPDRLRALLRSMVDDDPEARPAMYDVALELQRAAQSDEKLGAAVEAWVRRGKIPSAAELLELSRHADDPARLTEDEREFLQQAPLLRLKKLRAKAAVLTASSLILIAAASAVVVMRGVRSPWPVAGAMPLLHAAKPAGGEARAALDSAAQEAQRLEGTLQDERARLRAALDESAQRESALRALNAQLAELKRSRDGAQRQLELAQSRVAAGERALAECRGEAERQGKALAECRRDVEAHLGQLSESAERLRLCTKSLREQAERGPARRNRSEKARAPESSEEPLLD